MKYFVLSDLHANLEAVNAACQYLETLGAAKLLLLGDFVGYNSDPSAVIRIVRNWQKEGKILGMISGNHDQAVVNPLMLNRFNLTAREAVTWTASRLSSEEITWLSELPHKAYINSDTYFCHGSYRDSNEYIFNEEIAVANYRDLTPDIRLLFFGHTHVPVIYEFDNDNTLNTYMVHDEGHFTLKSGRKYMINPGSIGQPRNQDPRISFLSFDEETSVVTFYKKEYRFDITQLKIIKAGLPEILATRLQEGC